MAAIKAFRGSASKTGDLKASVAAKAHFKRARRACIGRAGAAAFSIRI